MRPPPCFEDRETKKRLEAICATNQIDTDLLVELCEVVYDYSGSGRREGVTADINTAIESFLQRSTMNP